MKKLLTLLLTATAFACAPKHNLEIKLNGFHNDTLILGVLPLSDYITNKYNNIELDTLVAHNGVVKTNIPTDDSAKYFQVTAHQLSVREGDHILPSLAGIIKNFITPDDKIRMEVTPSDEYIEVKVKRGSQANKDITNVRNQYRILAAEYFALLTGKSGKGLSAKEHRTAMQNSTDAMDKVIKDYIKNNPNNEASLFHLFNLGLYPNDMVEYIEHLNPNLLSNEWESVKALYEKAKEMNEVHQKASKMINENGMAFDFTLNDINGKEFTLSSLRGKWVVLEFWGSWCGPCMQGGPKMKKYYDRYHNKMEIVSIACNDKEEPWRKAVKKNNMTWTNLLHPKGVKPTQSIIMNYSVNGYPTKVIITPEGRIHKVFTGETEDFYKEIDKIMK